MSLFSSAARNVMLPAGKIPLRRTAVRRTARGLSLTELLVGIVIGVLLVGGIIYAFVAGYVSFRVNDDMARLQENGRLAVTALERDIRQAGYQGCMALDLLEPLADAEGIKQGLKTAFSVGDARASANQANFAMWSALEGEGALKVAATAGSGSTDVVPAGSQKFQIDWVNNEGEGLPSMKNGDYLSIGTCAQGELLRVAAAEKREVTLHQKTLLSHLTDVNEGDVVQPYRQVRYAFAPPAGDAPEWQRTAGKEIGALTRNGEVLVDGVQVFRICAAELGRDGKIAAVKKLAPGVAIDWENVSALQVDLLLVAPSKNGKSKVRQDFALCGDLSASDTAAAETFSTDDTLLRRLFSTRISVRNRQP